MKTGAARLEMWTVLNHSKRLDLRIEEAFELNSMLIVRIDGSFRRMCARSESGYRAHHVTLEDALSET